MTFKHVFSRVTVDNVAYTLCCSPVSIYIFTFGPGHRRGWCAHTGGAVGQQGKWLIRPATSLKIVHLAPCTKRLDTPEVQEEDQEHNWLTRPVHFEQF